MLIKHSLFLSLLSDSNQRPRDYKSRALANWAKEANTFEVERKTRLELATPTLARLCSTNWAISAGVVRGGIEPPLQEWKSWVLTDIRTDHPSLKWYRLSESFFLRYGRDSNPRPPAWQAGILTSWTTTPTFYRTHYLLESECKGRCFVWNFQIKWEVFLLEGVFLFSFF